MSAAIGPGTRVKCVREGKRWLKPHPKIGSVHTVIRIVRDVHHASTGVVYHLACQFLVLEHWKHIYGAPNFVPIDGNEDLSVLTGLLDKLPGRVKELA